MRLSFHSKIKYARWAPQISMCCSTLSALWNEWGKRIKLKTATCYVLDRTTKIEIFRLKSPYIIALNFTLFLCILLRIMLPQGLEPRRSLYLYLLLQFVETCQVHNTSLVEIGDLTCDVSLFTFFLCSFIRSIVR